MIILGIDPGYAIVGYGVLEYNGRAFRVIDYGAVTTKAGLDPARRLEIIYDARGELLDRFHPDDVAIEELFFKVKAFTRKFIAGIVLEVIFTIASVLIFIFTEDMKLPMVLIDKWTPVMLLLMIGSMIADFILTRYKRPKKDKNDENEIRIND